MTNNEAMKILWDAMDWCKVNVEDNAAYELAADIFGNAMRETAILAIAEEKEPPHAHSCICADCSGAELTARNE